MEVGRKLVLSWWHFALRRSSAPQLLLYMSATRSCTVCCVVLCGKGLEPSYLLVAVAALCWRKQRQGPQLLPGCFMISIEGPRHSVSALATAEACCFACSFHSFAACFSPLLSVVVKSVQLMFLNNVPGCVSFRTTLRLNHVTNKSDAACQPEHVELSAAFGAGSSSVVQVLLSTKPLPVASSSS